MIEFILNNQDWYFGFAVIFGIAGYTNFRKKEDPLVMSIVTAIIYGIVWPLPLASSILGDK